MKIIKSLTIYIICFIFPSLIFAKAPDLVSQKSSTTTPVQSPIQVNISDESVLNWAKSTAPKIRTYNFVQKTEQMNQIKKYFTLKPWLQYFDRSPGWDEYYHSLQHEMNIAHEKRWFVDAKLNGNPVLVNKFVKDNTMFWQIKIPLLVSYISVNEKSQNQIKMMMILSTCTHEPIRQKTTNITNSKTARSSINPVPQTTKPAEICIERFYEVKNTN